MENPFTLPTRRQLSQNEVRLCYLLASGTYAEDALSKAFHISRWTLRSRVAKLYRKIGTVHSRYQLGLWAQERVHNWLPTAQVVEQQLGSTPETPPCKLTPREYEVCTYIVVGLPYFDIASAMGISEHTVARYVRNIREKTELENKVQIAVWFVRTYEVNAGSKE